MININGARLSPCIIPALIEKYDVFPSGVRMVDEVSVYRTLMAERICLESRRA